MPLIKEFRAIHQKVTFALSFGDTPEIIDTILKNKADFAFCDDGPYRKKFGQISFTQVFKEELVLVCSRAYYDKHIKSGQSYRHLTRLDHIPYNPFEEGVRKWYIYHFKKVPPLTGSLMIDNASGVVTAIRMDFGLGVVPRSMIQQDVESGQMVVIKTKDVMENQVLLVQLKDKAEKGPEKHFLRFLRETATN